MSKSKRANRVMGRNKQVQEETLMSMNPAITLDSAATKTIVEKTTRKKERALLSLLTEWVFWVFSLFLITFVFYQVLPVLLILLGSTSGLLGQGTTAPTIVDSMVFLLTGLSFTFILTKLFISMMKRIVKRMLNLTQNLPSRWAKKSK